MSTASLPSTPSIKRRLFAMVYEAFLLLAVDMLAVALWLLVTRNSQAPVAKLGMNVFLFLVTGAYFVYNWTSSGHTLAMKTWRMRVTRAGAHAGAPVTFARAVLRYLLAWGWVLPALAACGLRGPTSWGQVGITVGAGIVAWAMSAFLDPDRQFLHDRLAGTRVVALPKRARRQAAADAAPVAEAS